LRIVPDEYLPQEDASPGRRLARPLCFQARAGLGGPGVWHRKLM